MVHLRTAAACVVALLAVAGCSDGEGDEAVPTPEAPLETATLTFSPSPEPEVTVPVGTATTATPTTSPRTGASATATSAATPPGATPVDPATSRPPLETAPPTGQPLCDAKDLTVTDADAIITETAVQELFVVRTKGPDCELRGYPSVELRDARGNVVRAAARPGGFGLPAERPTTHTLSTGTSISFVVASGRTGTCVPAAVLSARLPGTSAALRTATSFSVCDQAIGVSPIGRQVSNE